MRILLLNQFFCDGAPTGQLLGDVAAELVERGHQVTVVAGAGSYATGLQDVPPGLTVHRVPVWKFSRTPGSRLLSWISFLSLAFLRSAVLRRHQVIVAMTTPPGLSVPAVLLSTLWRSRLWVWEMDVYPDVAVSLGVVNPKAPAIRLCSSVIDWSRRRAHGLIALGECMRGRLAAHGISQEKIVVRENWTDGEAISPRPFHDKGPLRVLYSGNLGFAHEVETILDVLKDHGNDPRFEFRFAGGGACRPYLEEECRLAGITNVAFETYCKAEDLSTSLGSCDISLVTLRQECLGTVVPSKVYSAFAAARPVMFIGPQESQSARIIEANQCGWVFAPGESVAIGVLLKSLAEDRIGIARAGTNAYSAFRANYDLHTGASRVADTVSGFTVELAVHTTATA